MRFISILLCLGFTLVALAWPAQAADPFTVAKIRVDGRGGSAIEAQTRAMQSGYRVAADILFDRLTLQSERQANPLPELTPSVVGPLIRGQSIENERRSTTQYLGDVTIAFNPSAVQAFLRQNGLTMVNSQAAERLIIPVSSNPESRFVTDVLSGRYAHALVPLRPVSEAGLNEYLISATDYTAETIARRNDLDRVMIVRELGGGELSVRDIDLSDQAASDRRVSGGMRGLVAALEADWKQTTAVPSSEAVSTTATVLYNSLDDWQFLQRAINTSAQIRDARLDALSKDGALMSVSYGQFERLQAEMRQKGVRIERDPVLGVVIRR